MRPRSYVRLDLPFRYRQGRIHALIYLVFHRSLKGPWCRLRREARARKRHRHRSRGQSDVLDPGRPIREADVILFVVSANVTQLRDLG